MRVRLGPIGFLFAVASGWTVVRSVVLWIGREVPEAPAPPRIAWQAPLKRPLPPGMPPPVRAVRLAFVSSALPQRLRLATVPAASVASAPTVKLGETPAPSPSVSADVLPVVFVEQVAPFAQTASAQSARDRSPSLSSWLLVRKRADAAGLAAAGQLGGSQAGARLRVPVTAGFAAAMRVSGPVRQRLGKEAAVGLDWASAARAPATLFIERRVGLDAGGRDAWAVGAFGGAYGIRAGGLELDGYAQAGLVGLHRRDLFVDGAVRAEAEVLRLGPVRIGIGAGGWGGAQPGAARLDVGPQLVAHLPTATGGARLAFEWRARAAGNALPGSGPALTLGADF